MNGHIVFITILPVQQLLLYHRMQFCLNGRDPAKCRSYSGLSRVSRNLSLCNSHQVEEATGKTRGIRKDVRKWTRFFMNLINCSCAGGTQYRRITFLKSALSFASMCPRDSSFRLLQFNDFSHAFVHLFAASSAFLTPPRPFHSSLLPRACFDSVDQRVYLLTHIILEARPADKNTAKEANNTDCFFHFSLLSPKMVYENILILSELHPP